MNQDEAVKQFAEAVQQLGISVQQIAEAFQQALVPYAKELVEWSQQLWRDLEPFHRSLMYEWLLKRHVPHIAADFLATQFPRNWLLPMDRLYRELVGPDDRCPRCDVVLLPGEKHICEAWDISLN